MVFKFRIVSDEVDDFRRDIEIDSDCTFLDLHNAICDSVGYDKSQMHSFFICDRGWEKGIEITLEDMGSDAEQDVYLMADSVLGDLIEDEGQRLTFVFDYLTDRALFMELKSAEPGRSLERAECVLSRGTAPSESVDLDVYDQKSDAKAAAAAAADIDEDFYGSSEFNADEFDLEGFEEMDFDA